jgi:hypothetical protein
MGRYAQLKAESIVTVHCHTASVEYEVLEITRYFEDGRGGFDEG